MMEVQRYWPIGVVLQEKASSHLKVL